MSYRCEICENKVPSGKSLLRHVIYRDIPTTRWTAEGTIPGWRKEIQSELKVCEPCGKALERGGILENLVKPKRALPAPRPREPITVKGRVITRRK